MNKNTLWWVLAILIVVVVGIFWYRSSQNAMNTSPATSNQTGEISGNVNPTTPTSTQTSGGSTSTNTPATVTVNVSGGNYYFAPNAITVKKDQTVTIHFTNAGGIHDLVLQEFGVATPRIGSGQTADITFTATKTGSFEYYCSVGDHRAMGMKGTLTVE